MSPLVTDSKVTNPLLIAKYRNCVPFTIIDPCQLLDDVNISKTNIELLCTYIRNIYVQRRFTNLFN